MSVRIVGEGWESYLQKVLPKDSPEVQVLECQRAFYAGAVCIFFGIMARLSDEADPTTEEEDMMAAIEQELVAFTALQVANEDVH